MSNNLAIRKSDILIVGGGTAGFTTALILKRRFPKKDISVVKSDKIGVIGVGEGSTEHWSYFMEFCGLDWKEVVRETDAAIKIGIKYVNWADKDYYHNVDGRFYNTSLVGQLQGSYIYSYINDKPQIDTTDDLSLESKVPDEDWCCSNQYHFNALKLRDYLEKKCLERGVNVHTDLIEDVIMRYNIQQNIDGIDYIQGEHKYKADFYIDCTGFRRVLIGKLGAKWVSYQKYLIMNEAIAFPTEDTPEYPVYTTITAMKYGWMWQTPVYGRWGNGYVFNNKYINAREAQDEVEAHLGHKVELFKNIKFEPGTLDKFWIHNCMALGLSANFIEPLEATSIGSSINQTFMFMNYFDNYDEYQIEHFNKQMTLCMENLRDFVIIHYLVKKDDSQFWLDLQHVPIPKDLEYKLKLWKNRLPIEEDFGGSQYFMFYSQNFTSVLYGLGLLDKTKLKKIWDNMAPEHQTMIQNKVENYRLLIDHWKNHSISHKRWLAKVREIC